MHSDDKQVENAPQESILVVQLEISTIYKKSGIDTDKLVKNLLNYGERAIQFCRTPRY